MATSTCVKCGSTSFEVKENTPKNSRFILLFVQCSSCGGVVGTMDYYNIGNQITEQNEALKRIAQAVNTTVYFK